MSNTDFSNDDRFDGLYLQVAGQARGIEPMLDTVFSFLRRKTDFFNGPSGEGTDTAVNKVNEVLQKHIRLYSENEGKKKVEQEKTARRKAAAADAKNKKKKGNDVTVVAATGAKIEDGVIELGQDGFDASKAESSTPHVATQSPPPSSKSKSAPKPKEDDDSKSAPSTQDNDNDDGPPPLGNGGTVDGKYVWTQTLSELNVTIPIQDNTRGRDLNVTISKKHLKVGFKSQAPDYIVNAPLVKAVILDDSFWTVEDGNRIVVNLQKLNQMEWWDSVCIGDPTIDIKKVQPENSKLDELDGETRQTVEKMMHDQRQKALGLPTSEEQGKHDMLEKFKKAHPEMDFSNAKIS
eukprot:CAMPEP_0198253362 /NCGR_PEP_ID=MMETSP1447-20131203/3809_1 /TAXON_ID=420782 /ORGANISM="Chaetoceros dichaeta, Strain CCMP1751" /LENGTH=348 /DNA_ID=CAMNT_0043939017 /DNA_START=101 /DNA_END=1147 /DNA_ORIENTATION=-